MMQTGCRLVPDEALVLVEVAGRIDQTTAVELDRVLRMALSVDPMKPILVDLTAVSYINSGGLRCLVTAWKHGRGQNQPLWLCGLNYRLQETFAMIGFDQIFRIFEDVETARAAG